ncbi:tyrosine-type recombinase/integrase [Actinoplanes sp. G11-F43]|uniref:tyrosine-type recombinase/integrase n=1 Tax=Actinoplanes sp. G11-F43 TaxID=3424130 RepID=UPI003D34D4ED
MVRHARRSLARYWTVLDDGFAPVQDADAFLRHLRFGRDAAESTTASYAGSLALFLDWCGRSNRRWADAAGALGSFMLWLRHQPVSGPARGPGAAAARGEKRVNAILAAVRGFLAFAVAEGRAPALILSQLYELGDDRDLPAELRGEDGRLRVRARARHRLVEPQDPVDRATDDEVLALLKAAKTARDRFLVLLLARAGLRRGEAVGLRREDIHFMADSSALGCRVSGPHLHVVRRDNVNGAWAKSRHSRHVPADRLLIQSYDQYWPEREAAISGADNDFVLVVLRTGDPMGLGTVNEVFERLCGRAGLDRTVTPHMLRHAFGSNVLDAGGALDEAQALLGHRSPSSTQVYLHPDFGRLRDAVDRVAIASRMTTTGPTR